MTDPATTARPPTRRPRGPRRAPYDPLHDPIIRVFRARPEAMAAMQIPLSDDRDEWRRLAGWAGMTPADPARAVAIGDMHGRRGDWIVMTERCQKYIVPRALFDALFEPVEGRP